MKTTILAATVLALAGSSMAYADPPWARGYDRGHDRYDRHDYRDARHDNGRHNGHWRAGQRLDRSVHYVVINQRDYGRYRLRPPPRGYYYANVDGDVLLVAAATGLILSAIYNS